MNPKSISEERSALFDLYSRDHDLSRQNEISNKADIRFKKSRQGISKNFIRKGKELVAKMVEHPRFRGWTSDSQKTLFEQFSKFKPKKTYFESREGRKMKNHEKVVHAIDKLRAIQEREKKTEEVKREIMKRSGQTREQFFELKEEEVDRIVRSKKTDGTINKNPYRSKFFIETVTTEKGFKKGAGKKGKSVFDVSASGQDWDMVTFADKNESVFNRQKKVWNSKRMKYVGVTVDGMGQNLDRKSEKEREYQKRTGKLKKKFGMWKRVNKIELKKEGEAEDAAFTRQMRSRFQSRKRQNFRMNKGAPGRGRPGKGSKVMGRVASGGKKKNKKNKIRKKF